MGLGLVELALVSGAGYSRTTLYSSTGYSNFSTHNGVTFTPHGMTPKGCVYIKTPKRRFYINAAF